ncbi:MAG: hypothetical protein EPN76_08780 [Burkholderiaceae bacterium]|nr:MAG: hypothetical protein EPN76_08780 [Burkholderiaceae bacterium]
MNTEPEQVSLNDLAGLPSMATLVLTVNNRHARRILADLSAMLDAQRQVMALPDIMPVSAWLRQAGDQWSFASDNGLAAHTVDAFGALSLWRQVIIEAETDHALLDVGNAASLAQEADRLLSEWQLEVPPALQTDEYRRFMVWRKAYRQRLHDMDAEDGVLGFERVYQAIVDGKLHFDFQNLVLVGFNEYSPRLRGVIDALRAQGVAIFALQPSQVDAAQVERVQAADPDTEWRLAARWAQSCLRANPEGRYAIVAARLENDVALAHRVLREALGADGTAPAVPYNIAVARPLADWPLVRAALCWLRVLRAFLLHGRCEPSLAGAALLSGGCAAHVVEAPGRATLDARWRRDAVISITEQYFEKQLAQWAPRLAQAWKECLALGKGWNNVSLDVWVVRWRLLLQQLGFPGEAVLDSHAYQVVEALDRTLDRLGRQAAVLGSGDLRYAMSLLERLVRETPFQPQRDPSARLDVQGFLEAEGGHWDGVWILGLTDDVFPAAAKPNPLIPLAALRQANAPRATPERELQWAQALYQALLRCAPRVSVSHALLDGERELRPSPCIEDLAAAPAAALSRPAASCELERVTDDSGPALLEGEDIRGGIAVIDTQARNPLWAFVKYRLGARQLDDYAVLSDQNARGLFLHGAMETLWHGIPDQATLRRHRDTGHLDELVDQAIRHAASEHLCDYSPALRDLEVERAGEVLGNWLELELARAPFAVEAVERSFPWSYGSLHLTLRLDRIDRLEDERLAVIDYKTGLGKLDPENHWTRRRPIELQLPFYASLLTKENAQVGALALARLHARVIEVKGLADGDCGFEGLANPEDWPGFAGQSWEQVLAQWRAAISGLAQEFVDGVAVNRNLRADDIKYCDVLPFLRLNEEAGHDD